MNIQTFAFLLSLCIQYCVVLIELYHQYLMWNWLLYIRICIDLSWWIASKSYQYLFVISYCQIMSILVAYGNLSISATTNLRLWFIHNKQRTVACALAISLTFILLLENSCNFISIINYFYWFVFISTEYLNI